MFRRLVNLTLRKSSCNTRSIFIKGHQSHFIIVNIFVSKIKTKDSRVKLDGTLHILDWYFKIDSRIDV